MHKCLVHIHTPRLILFPKFKSHVLIGYDIATKAYRCFHLKTNKVLVSKDVIFYEDYMRLTLVKTTTPKENVTAFVHLPWKEIYIATKIAQINHQIKVYPFP
jgi:hypothetical protein